MYSNQSDIFEENDLYLVGTVLQNSLSNVISEFEDLCKQYIDINTNESNLVYALEDLKYLTC